ncbi:MAG: hypothetical protein WBO10_14015 [Pyrinomonadaceae bacterium]
MGKINDFIFGSIEQKVRIVFGIPTPTLIPPDDPTIVLGPCCFCGKDILESPIDPCTISVETAGEKWQVWFCHAACFKSRLISNAEPDLSPAHF